MTPCEKLGYKVGDRFEVINPEQITGNCSAGDIVILHRDDGTTSPFFRKEGRLFAHDCGYIRAIKPIRKGNDTIKTGDTIEQDGKKYRVTLEEIPQYDFKPGMVCLVNWDGSEYCSSNSKSGKVIYLCEGDDGYSRVAYATNYSAIAQGFVKTSNLRPE